jgi:hypothetical protein
MVFSEGEWSKDDHPNPAALEALTQMLRNIANLRETRPANQRLAMVPVAPLEPRTPGEACISDIISKIDFTSATRTGV